MIRARPRFLSVARRWLRAAAGCGLSVAAGAAGLTLAPQSGARFQCGPATLASVLAYHGVPVAESAIAAAIYSPTARGVLLTDLAWFARQKGLRADVRTGTEADLRRELAAGRPPVVLLDVGLAGLHQPHITAVTAWDEDGVRYLGTKLAGKTVSPKTFLRQWQRAGNQCLVIAPAS